MVAEISSIPIKEGDAEVINVGDETITISQFAGDTVLFLINENQIPITLKYIDQFSKASGLHLNIHKSEILTIHEYPLESLNTIKIKKDVKYLGITISKDKTIMENLKTVKKNLKM